MSEIVTIPAEVHVPLADVRRYVDRTPQQMSRYVKAGLIKKRDRGTVTLPQFTKFLARKFPHLPRFGSVADYDTWVANGRPAAQ